MSLLDDVSIVVTPNGYKAGELYAVVPVPTYGAELVTNGDFATDTDWTINTGWTISGGSANCDGNNQKKIYQNIGLAASKSYEYIIDVKTLTSGTITLFYYNGSYQTIAQNLGLGTHNLRFSTSGTPNGSIYVNSNSFIGSVDNVSVKEYTSADMDVTRATAATRVDENGLVNYAEVIGGDIVTCGDFSCAVPLDSWTEGTGWDIANGKASCDGTNISYLTQVSILNTGTSYKVQFDIIDYTSGSVKYRDNGLVSGQSFSGIGSYTDYVVAGGGQFRLMSENFIGSISNVSVKEVTRDNVPRIDYTGGGCPHILAEPQRTNEFTFSSDFSQSVWTNQDTSTIIGQLSPDGTLNAFNLSENSSLTNHRLQGVIFNSLTNGVDYTFSIFAKNNGRLLQMITSRSAFGNKIANFDLDNGVIGDVSVGFSATIESFGNGWFKCSVTVASVGTQGQFHYGLVTSTTSVLNEIYQGDGTSGIYIYGAQLEVGSYLTSYIPTSGGTVTRNQDIFTRDGIGSLINSTEGVLFVEMARQEGDTSAGLITLNDGTNSQTVSLYYFSTGTIYFDVLSGSPNVSVGVGGFNTYNFNKIALKYKSGDIALWVNGVEVATSASAISLTGLNTLSFNQGNNAYPFNGKVKQLQVYDTALTDEQLLQLTGESGTDFYESYAEMASALTYTIQ